jgi:putative nucleotidyltransferase with HDIG domain
MGEVRPENQDANLDININQLSSLTKVDSDTYAEATKDYREYPLNNLSINQVLPVDLYIPMLDQSQDQVVMYKVFPKDKPLYNKDKGYLINMGIRRFFLHNSQFSNYIAYKNEHAHRLINKPGVAPGIKSELLYDNANLIISQAMSEPRLGDNIDLGVQYIKDLTEFVTASPDHVQSISEFLAVDYSLYTHSVNVCLLVTSFCHYLGMNKQQILPMGVGGLYHDIGKRKIADDILHKPDELSEDEWAEMQKHPTYGYNLLRTSTKLDPTVFKMVHQHHENLDGSGYPQGITEPDITTPAKIIRIIDIYDALTSKRVYKEPAAPMEAIAIIVNEMSSQVSPSLLKSFMGFLGWMVSGPLAQAKIKKTQQQG